MSFQFKTVFDAILAKLAVIYLGMMLVAAQASGTDWSSESLPQYDRLFQQTNGWTGADGDFTVKLTNDLTLWLFSDTFIGEVRDGHRVGAAMITNSAALQHGNNAANARVEFFYGKSNDGKPAALVAPADGKGFFWLFDGVMARRKMFLFLTQIEHTDDKSAFGFRQIGTWLGEVSNPTAPPTQWHIIQKQIPFAHFGTGGSRSFGSAILATNGFVYIYGTDERKGMGKTMILARAPEGTLGDFATWQFCTRNGWSPNVEAAMNLCSGMASEYSVSWLPALRRYVLICTEIGLSEKIIARTAVDPWGPWSAPTVVYRCPDTKGDKRIFCYAAKAHPMLASAPG